MSSEHGTGGERERERGRERGRERERRGESAGRRGCSGRRQRARPSKLAEVNLAPRKSAPVMSALRKDACGRDGKGAVSGAASGG